MVVKQGRYGEFLACSGYPDCKNTMSINGSSAVSTGIKCPESGCDGELVERKSKRGKVFYGCSNYPDCTYAIWERPVDRKCPDCDADFIAEKTTKKQGTFLTCLNPDCDFTEPVE
jgi:DNA topoisomerase-1